MGADNEIVEVIRNPGDTRMSGDEWHTDTTMMAEPPVGAILYGLEVPPVGGGAGCANQYRAYEVPPVGGDMLFFKQKTAYEMLSSGMKDLIKDLRAVHSDRKVAGPNSGYNSQRTTKVREDADWRETVSIHPVVRTHPETGRKLL